MKQVITSWILLKIHKLGLCKPLHLKPNDSISQEKYKFFVRGCPILGRVARIYLEDKESV